MVALQYAPQQGIAERREAVWDSRVQALPDDRPVLVLFHWTCHPTVSTPSMCSTPSAGSINLILRCGGYATIVEGLCRRETEPPRFRAAIDRLRGIVRGAASRASCSSSASARMASWLTAVWRR